MPVFSGVNRGSRWVVGAGIHACWLGTYEREKLRLVASFVRPGMTIFDVGAHAGYYTLAFARLVGSQGKVVAFEPNQVNLSNLRKHIEINRLKNVEVVAAAVSDHAGTVRFAAGNPVHTGEHHYVGKVADEGIEVPSVRLDDFGSPDLIKMDIEGGEGLAMIGALRILAEEKARIFVALHGVSDEQCLSELRRHGYEFTYIGHDEIHAWPTGTSEHAAAQSD